MDKTQLVLITTAILLAIALLLYLVTIYNSLVAVRREVARAWANIDVLLKQRFDELPKLVEVCRAYMKYEQETLDKVISARRAFAGATTVDAKAGLLSTSSSLLGRLFAVSERYPELKADNQFAHLRQRISQLETRIADRRETYNDVVNAHNVRIAQLPDLLLARPMGYRPLPLFDVGEGERSDPAAGLWGPASKAGEAAGGFSGDSAVGQQTPGGPPDPS